MYRVTTKCGERRRRRVRLQPRPSLQAHANPMTTNGTIAWIVIVIGMIPITGKVLFSAWRLVRRVA